jgi:hypothetical protein
VNNPFENIDARLSNLERLLQDIKTSFDKKVSQDEIDVWFNIAQLCNYLPEQPAKATVYGWVSKKFIPFHKKSKALFFLKSEVDVWLKDGLHKSTSEISRNIIKSTDSYLGTKRRQRKY